MRKIFSFIIFICITTLVYGQNNVLVIDYNNAFSSDQQNNNSIIYNRLVATQTIVTRVTSIPATINNATYDEVWIFGNMGTSGPTVLNPVVTFMNNGGAVYVQSEVGCCNNQAAFVDALINATVTVGGSINHSATKSSYYEFEPAASIACTPWTAHGAAVRPFPGTPAANILFEATPTCGGPITTGDVVAVQFSACDMLSGQGALVSSGDFNIFPLSGTCSTTGILGTPNDNMIIDLIADLMDSLLVCSNFNTTAPTINPIVSDTFCVGDTIPASLFVSNPASGAINWTNNNTAIGLSANGTGNTPQFIATNTSSNIISGTVSVTSTLAGCTGPPTNYTITVVPPPTMSNLTDLTFCNNDTVPASSFSSIPSGSVFTWTNSNTSIGLGASGNGNTPSFIASNSTANADSTIITVTPTLYGCLGTPSNYTVIVNPSPSANSITNLTFCAGDTVPASSFSGTPTGVIFSWTNSNTAIGLTASGTGNTPVFIATNVTNSPITSTITVIPENNGCFGLPVTYTITVNPNSLSAGAGSQICLGDPINLSANANGNGTITWYSDPNGTNVIGTGSPFSPTINNTGTYTYYVNEIGGCTSNMDSVTIIVMGVQAVINANPTSGIVPLTVFFGNGSTTGPGITYMWDFGTGDSSTVFQPSYTYNDEGSYVVTLIVSDGFCSDTTSITIDVIKESILIIPNVFTPNGDNNNDFFELIEVNIKSVEGEIYNRWGQKLFSWNQLNGRWNGETPSGDPAPDGTYFYIIEAVGEDDTEYLKKGSFSLIR